MLLWYVMYDVWCMMCDVWCVMYDVWCMMCDVWCMMYDVWCMMCDAFCCDLWFFRRHVLSHFWAHKTISLPWRNVCVCVCVYMCMCVCVCVCTCVYVCVHMYASNLILSVWFNHIRFLTCTPCSFHRVEYRGEGSVLVCVMCDAWCIDVWCMMYDIWCMMYDAWCVMYDIWCMMHDVWCMMHDVWCMMYDVWCMMYDARCMMYDIWCILQSYLWSHRSKWQRQRCIVSDTKYIETSTNHEYRCGTVVYKRRLCVLHALSCWCDVKAAISYTTSYSTVRARAYYDMHASCMHTSYITRYCAVMYSFVHIIHRTHHTLSQISHTSHITHISHTSHITHHTSQTSHTSHITHILNILSPTSHWIRRQAEDKLKSAIYRWRSQKLVKSFNTWKAFHRFVLFAFPVSLSLSLSLCLCVVIIVTIIDIIVVIICYCYYY